MDVLAIAQVLAANNNVAVFDILRVSNVHAGHIHILRATKVLDWKLFPEGQRLLSRFREPRPGVEPHFLELRFIFLLRILLVPDAVLLVAKIDAAETAGTTTAIPGEPYIGAFGTLRRKAGLIALPRPDALITSFALAKMRVVEATFGKINAIAIRAILGIIRVENKVAVFRPAGICAVIAVFKGEHVSVRARDSSYQLEELFEKWAREVIISAI